MRVKNIFLFSVLFEMGREKRVKFLKKLLTENVSYYV